MTMLKFIDMPLAGYQSNTINYKKLFAEHKSQAAKLFVEKNAIQKENEALRTQTGKKAAIKSCRAVEWGFLIS